MHVRMTRVVVVHVIVHDVFMDVYMRVHVPATRFLQAPGKIDETEREQRVACNVASRALNLDKCRELRAEQDTGNADDNGANHVSEAAHGRDPKRPGERPAARLAHRRENEVVVRPEHRVQDGDRCRGIQEYLGFSHPISLRQPRARARYVQTTSFTEDNPSSNTTCSR